MTTITSREICELPLSREEMGFPKEGDRGNAVLLLAQEMQAKTRAAYLQAGCIHEGVSIDSCDEGVFTILEQLQIRYCPWPDQGFTLAVLEHSRLAVLADRLVVLRLLAANGAQESDRSNERNNNDTTTSTS